METSTHNGLPSTPHTGSRRPTNLWTPQARDEMFRRREAGETWEQICVDYPKRSRHAMQQQYSMMKKQKALADGTWKSNRRGRKRKNPLPERWPPMTKGQEEMDQDDELTEEDEFIDGDSEEVEEIDGPEVGSQASYHETSRANGRPSPVGRSATDPPMRPQRGKMMHSSSHSLTSPLTVESANGPVTIMNEDQEPNGGYSNKRRRYSPDTNKPPPYGPGHLSTFNSGLQLDQEEILALFKKGADRAEQSKANMDADVVNIKKALEASSARANRRASEAIDSLRYAHHEGGERIKDRERIYADGLKNKTREFQEKEQALKREHELNMKYQEGIQIKNIEALTRQNDKLREELEAVRQDGMGSLGESRERELQYEISSLRRQLENTRFDSKATLSPPPSNAHESVKAPYGQHDSSAEQLSRLQKRVAELANIAKSVQDAQKASQHSFQGGLSDFTTLSSVLTDFIDDYYVTSPDEISEELNKMKEQNTATKASLMKTEAAFAAFRAELEVFVAEFTENDTISGATNGH